MSEDVRMSEADRRLVEECERMSRWEYGSIARLAERAESREVRARLRQLAMERRLEALESV